jgi:Rho GTPase-activating protein RGD1
MNAETGASQNSFSQIPQQSPTVRTSGPPMIPPGPNFEPLNDRPPQIPPYQNDGYRGAPAGPYAASSQNAPYPLGSGPLDRPIEKPIDKPYPDRPYNGPGQSQAPYDPYGSNQVGAFPRPVQGPAPVIPSPLNPNATRPLPPSGPSPRGPIYPPSRPVFGIHLNELFTRDQAPVPLVVYSCMSCVETFGLEHEGIYRVSGNATKVAQLKAMFDSEPNGVDLRDPSAFFHDINIPTTLLKLFFRELPDPLFTRQTYRDFLEAAAVPDDTQRRDGLHAAINNLPDPNYATLRALTLVCLSSIKHATF